MWKRHPVTAGLASTSIGTMKGSRERTEAWNLPAAARVTESQVEEAVRFHACNHETVLASAASVKYIRQKRELVRRQILASSGDLAEQRALQQLYHSLTNDYERCCYVLESQKIAFMKSQLDAQQKLFLQYFQQLDPTDPVEVDAWNFLQTTRREKEWCRVRCDRQELLYEMLGVDFLPDPLATDIKELNHVLRTLDLSQSQLTRQEDCFATALREFRALRGQQRRSRIFSGAQSSPAVLDRYATATTSRSAATAPCAATSVSSEGSLLSPSSKVLTNVANGITPDSIVSRDGIRRKVLSPFLPHDLQEELKKLEAEKDYFHAARGQRLAFKNSDLRSSPLSPTLRSAYGNGAGMQPDVVTPMHTPNLHNSATPMTEALTQHESSPNAALVQSPCVVPLVPSLSPAPIGTDSSCMPLPTERAASEPLAVPSTPSVHAAFDIRLSSPSTPSCRLGDKKRRVASERLSTHPSPLVRKKLCELTLQSDASSQASFLKNRDSQPPFSSRGGTSGASPHLPRSTSGSVDNSNGGHLLQLLHSLGFELNDEQLVPHKSDDDDGYEISSNDATETSSVRKALMTSSTASPHDTNTGIGNTELPLSPLLSSSTENEDIFSHETLNPEEERMMLQAILEAPLLTQWCPTKDESPSFSPHLSIPLSGAHYTPDHTANNTASSSAKVSYRPSRRPTLLGEHATISYPGSVSTVATAINSSTLAASESPMDMPTDLSHLATLRSYRKNDANSNGLLEHQDEPSCEAMDAEGTSCPETDEDVSMTSDEDSSPRTVGLLARPSDTLTAPSRKLPGWVGSSNPSTSVITSSSPPSGTASPPSSLMLESPVINVCAPSCSGVTAPSSSVALMPTHSHDFGSQVSPPVSKKKMEILNYVFGCLVNMTGVFTMKTRVYQTQLKQLLPEPQAGTQRYILQLPDPPRIPTSRPEMRTVKLLRGFPDTCSPNRRSTDAEGNHIVDLLEELLTSVVNKTMLMLVIENETWCIHAPAREQLVNHLLEFIWPQRTVIKNNFRDYVAAFVEARVRHFRDSVARHFREKAKQRAQRENKSMTSLKAPEQQPSSMLSSTLCSSLSSVSSPSEVLPRNHSVVQPEVLRSDSLSSTQKAAPLIATNHPPRATTSWATSVIALPHTTRVSRASSVAS